MSEPRGAWARPRPSASRTPQSRSSNASPNPSSSSSSNTTAPKPNNPAPAPAANIWAERAQERNRTAASGSRSSSAAAPVVKKEEGAAAAASKKEEGAKQNVATVREQHVPVNGFNDVAAREFLGRGPKVAPYKPADAASNKGGDVKLNHMANGQSFFAQLGKQVAALQSK